MLVDHQGRGSKMKNTRQQTDHHEIVGITEHGEIMMLNYTFYDEMHGKPFCGATGTVFVPVSQEEVDERNDVETAIEHYDLKHLWQEAVANDQTDKSLTKYVESLIEESHANGQEYFGHDDSYVHHIPDEFQEKFYPDAVTFECVGGGRCFDKDMKWSKLLRPELWESIKKAEGF
jgi:hypothetical protein